MDFALKNRNEITGTQWIEFNITNWTTQEHWSDSSKYLDECTFNFFTDLFEKNNDGFEYYGFTRFEEKQLLGLKKDLVKRIEEIQKLRNKEEVLSLSKKTSYGIDLSQPVNDLYDLMGKQDQVMISKLGQVTNDLLKIVDQCLENGNDLWVLGL